MLKIRLQRIGKKGQAYFRVVVMEHTKKPKGKYLEDLGAYDPHKNEISVDAERVKYWLSHGAQASPTVNNLLVGKGVIEGEKVQAWKASPRKHGTKPKDAGIQKKQTKTEEKSGTEATETQSEPESAEVKTAEVHKEPETAEQKIEPTEVSEEEETEEIKIPPEPVLE